MILHKEISDAELRKRIREKEVSAAGNIKLKIYGKLNCRSGKRMKRENRVFFKNIQEAIHNGFRPCGHCLRNEYNKYLKVEGTRSRPGR